MLTKCFARISAAAVLCGAALAASAAPDCPSSALARPKGNHLYLFFPTASDNTHPEYGAGCGAGTDTSPVNPFDVADLDAGIGTTAQLRNRVFDLVTDDYCEFNVEVHQATAVPAPTEPRWQVVGISSDSDPNCFGLAQDVDTGDGDAQDFARVWSGTFLDEFGGAGGALNGANSTLERWATAIAETTAHEAGHNYGAAHNNSVAIAGEDVTTNHVMATNALGLTGEIRAGVNRHFSNTSYGILAHNIGLNLKTLHNWDFVNPNATDAHSLKLTILSTASSLSLGWFYNGTLSPWTNPTVTATGGTQTFQGTTYNVHEVVFSTDKGWSGGPDGVAPPAVKFHVGATFVETDPIIVFDVELRDSGGAALALKPRLFGYDTGAADLASGDFTLTFFNPDPSDPLIIQDLQLWYLPRLAHIDSMMTGTEPFDFEHDRMTGITRPERYAFKGIELKDRVSIPLARLTDKRQIDIAYDPTNCKRGVVANARRGDALKGEIEYCQEGTSLSLFPATSVYLIATVVDPDAQVWDPVRKRYVKRALATKVFYQFAGEVPDFNRNGVDDLLDIRSGKSPDKNRNGVPDEAEGRRFVQRR